MLSVYLFLALFYAGLTIYTTARISRSAILSRRQKIANGIINALLPLLWYFLVSPIIFPAAKIMTKDERERLIREASGSKVGDEVGSSRDAGFGGS